MRTILDERQFAQPLHNGIVVHHHQRFVVADAGTASAMERGRLNRLLSQLPGRFCAPRAMDPSS